MSNMSKRPPTRTKKEVRVPPEVHAAFVRYEEASHALGLFVENNEKVINDYEARRTEHNQALDHVKALYKRHHDILGESYSGFVCETRRKVDLDKLLQLVPGLKGVLDFEYKLPIAQFDTLVADEVISDKVVAAVLKVEPHRIRGASER